MPRVMPGNVSKVNGKVYETSLQSMARKGLLGDGPQDPANPNTNGSNRAWCSPTAAIALGGNTNRSGARKGEKLLGGQAKEDGSRGSLNPEWVTQLMGYPDGWLDIEPQSLKPWETP